MADLNAVSPVTVRELAALAEAHGLDVRRRRHQRWTAEAGGDTMLYLSGDAGAGAGRTCRPMGCARASWAASRVRRPAVKMCTASVYKGTTALWAQALQTAHAHGVLDVVLADLTEAFPGDGCPRLVA